MTFTEDIWDKPLTWEEIAELTPAQRAELTPDDVDEVWTLLGAGRLSREALARVIRKARGAGVFAAFGSVLPTPGGGYPLVVEHNGPRETVYRRQPARHTGGVLADLDAAHLRATARRKAAVAGFPPPGGAAAAVSLDEVARELLAKPWTDCVHTERERVRRARQSFADHSRKDNLMPSTSTSLSAMLAELREMIVGVGRMAAQLHRFGGEEPPPGTVIKFEAKTFGNDKLYTYVGYRCENNGSWYLTGAPFNGHAIAFDELVTLIGANRLWVARDDAFDERPMPSLTTTSITDGSATAPAVTEEALTAYVKEQGLDIDGDQVADLVRMFGGTPR